MKLVSRTVLFALAAAMLTSAIIVPTVSAQQESTCGPGGTGTAQITIDAIVFNEDVVPLQPKTVSNIVLKYSYSAGYSINPITISITPTKPPAYAEITVQPTILSFAPPSTPAPTGTGGGGDSGQTLKFAVTVVFSRDAPAFKTTPFSLNAAATAGTCIHSTTTQAPTTFPVTPGFYGVLSASVPKTIQKAGQGSEVTFPMTIENLGNGQIKVFFQVEGQGKGTRSLQVTTPTEVTIDSLAQGGNSNTRVVNLNVNTPFKNGYMNALNAIRVVITSQSPERTGIEGDKASLSMLVRTQGVYVPGFDSVLMIGALLGAAMLVGVTRKREGGV